MSNWRKWRGGLVAAMTLGSLGAAQQAAAQWSENFDGMGTGTLCAPQFGWSTWDNAAAANSTIVAGGLSAPNRISITGTSDTIHTYTGSTSGKWRYSAMQFVPSTSVGDSYFILLNVYNHLGPYNWSVQLRCNATQGVCQSDVIGTTGPSVPLTTNAWVPIRCDINLTADTLKTYYNNLLVENVAWKRGNALAAAEVKCVDLYSAVPGSQAFYDNMKLEAVQTINLVCVLQGCIDPTGTPVDVELRTVGSFTPLETYSVVLSAAGTATIETTLSGPLDVAIKGDHYLRDTQSSVNVISNTVVTSLQANGDISGDNAVDIGDYALLSAAYGTFVGDPGYTTQSDLNCDGAVDIGDYALLSTNYGQFGDD